jgi:hypothetical protein
MPSSRFAARSRERWWATSVALVLVAIGTGGFFGATAAASAGANGYEPTKVLSSEQSTVLDAILHIAQPSAHWLPSQKAWVLPDTAFIRPSSVGFTTDCGDEPGPWQLGNSQSEKYYTITTKGTQQEACAGGAVGLETNMAARPGQYESALNRLASQVRELGGLTHSGAATSLVAHRQSVTAEFRCAYGGYFGTLPEKIVVRTQRAGRWAAMVTVCPPPPLG